LPLIEEELNVKQVTFITNLSEYMSFTVKPNFKEVGKTLGSKIKTFGDQLLTLDNKDIEKLQNGETIKMTLENEPFTIDETMIEIRTNSKEGFNVATHNENFIILSTGLTEELILEGISREFVSKIQNIRKTMEFDIVDRINIYYESDETVDQAIENYKEFIMNEVLGLSITKETLKEEQIDLNGHNAKIRIEKAN